MGVNRQRSTLTGETDRAVGKNENINDACKTVYRIENRNLKLKRKIGFHVPYNLLRKALIRTLICFSGRIIKYINLDD